MGFMPIDVAADADIREVFRIHTKKRAHPRRFRRRSIGAVNERAQAYAEHSSERTKPEQPMLSSQKAASNKDPRPTVASPAVHQEEETVKNEACFPYNLPVPGSDAKKKTDQINKLTRRSTVITRAPKPAEFVPKRSVSPTLASAARVKSVLSQIQQADTENQFSPISRMQPSATSMCLSSLVSREGRVAASGVVIKGDAPCTSGFLSVSAALEMLNRKKEASSKEVENKMESEKVAVHRKPPAARPTSITQSDTSAAPFEKSVVEMKGTAAIAAPPVKYMAAFIDKIDFPSLEKNPFMRLKKTGPKIPMATPASEKSMPTFEPALNLVQSNTLANVKSSAAKPQRETKSVLRHDHEKDSVDASDQNEPSNAGRFYSLSNPQYAKTSDGIADLGRQLDNLLETLCMRDDDDAAATCSEEEDYHSDSMGRCSPFEDNAYLLYYMNAAREQ